MKTILRNITLETNQHQDFIEITPRVRGLVKESGLRNGLVTILTQHTTSAIILNEQEPGLQQDMLAYIKKQAPAEQGYLHDRNPIDGRINAHSHLSSLFMPASQSVPLVEGELLLGQWQALFFLELDGPRPRRTIQVHILGE